MNLICFPSFGAGGIVCDLLNDEKSGDDKSGGIENLNSSRLKVPYNGNSILWYHSFFEKKVKKLNLNDNIWVGTHCWPTEVDVSRFNKVLVITTEEIMSKIYRLMRIYFLFDRLHKNHNFDNNKFNNIEQKLNNIDLDNFKFNYTKQYQHNIINLELQDIIEWNDNFLFFIQNNSINYSLDHFLERKEFWKNSNSFLYDRSLIEKFINRYKEYAKL